MVVNKRTHTLVAGDVYIGRGSRWGNRFSHRAGTRAEVVVGSREEAVEAYRRELWANVQAGVVSVDALAALHGRTLVCFCAPLACHGDVLERAAAWAVKQLQEVETCAAHGDGYIDPAHDEVGYTMWDFLDPKEVACGKCRPCIAAGWSDVIGGRVSDSASSDQKEV